MNDSFSKKLLLAIVHSLRNTCGNCITSENFIVISGFLSCDIDGKTQHRFVINELISRESSREGHHSSCLKVIDWNYLSKRLSSPRNEKIYKQNSTNQLPVAINHKVRICRGGQTKSRCVRAATKMRQKFVNCPVGYCQLPGSRNKRSNQTFTLEDLEIPACSDNRGCHLIRNFSSATISIASQKVLPERQTSPEMSSEKTSSTLSCTHKVSSSLSRSVRSLCEDHSCKLNENGGSGSSFLNSTMSHNTTQKSNFSQTKIIKNSISADVKKTNNKKYQPSKGSTTSEKSLKAGKDHLKVQNVTNMSKRKTAYVFEKSRNSLNSGDSDISIDSIRPRYLVQHNDELLLPCPNLSSKYSKHLATTQNNNRTFNMHLPSQSSEESVTNPSHFSNLLSSIIGALSYSNLVNVHDASKNLHVVSQGFSGGKLIRSGNNDESSNDSLKSVSSLETDSYESTLSNTSNSKIQAKVVHCGKSAGSKEKGNSSSSATKTMFLH
ncbi:hypothetical protein BsWGS_01394 [Bradybaena similaris]